MKQPITIIMTSCERWDLFQQTLDSFFALNSYPYVAFHIHNDSVQPIPQEIKDKYADKGITWHEGTKRGLSAAWDYLVALVETPHFLNLEEDWIFENNANFVEDALNYANACCQVWIRHHKDHKHPLGTKVNMPIPYRMVKKNGDWCGFSFNPSIRALHIWKQKFPNGISGKDEIEISREVSGNYIAYSLENTACKHIGWDRHTKNFKI